MDCSRLQHSDSESFIVEIIIPVRVGMAGRVWYIP